MKLVNNLVRAFIIAACLVGNVAHVEDFSSASRANGETGYVDVTPPPFSLDKISPSFVNSKYLPGTDREYLLDPEGQTIILFLKDTQGKISKIYSPRSRSDLAFMMVGLKEDRPDAYAYFQQAMKFPNPSDWDMKRYEEQKRQEFKDQKTLDAALSKRVDYANITFEQDHTISLKIINFFVDKNVVLKTDLGHGTQAAIMDIKSGAIIKGGVPEDLGQNVALRTSLAGMQGVNHSLSMGYDGTKRENDIKSKPAPIIPTATPIRLNSPLPTAQNN
ncbi:MAG: hypothetical protein P4M13_04190 [Alphaproteobacteria bacterium]|nr:hypothetical protein [Alphaproteobacteria bacterium]